MEIYTCIHLYSCRGVGGITKPSFGWGMCYSDSKFGPMIPFIFEEK